MVNESQLTHKTRIFQGNQQLLKDYCEYQDLACFNDINAELISLSEQKYLKIYKFDKYLQLMAKMFNYSLKFKSFNEQITSVKLFQNKFGKYTAIFSEKQKNHFITTKKEILSKPLPKPNNKKINKDKVKAAEEQPEARAQYSGLNIVSQETTESENTEQSLLSMLQKKDKQTKHKSSIDIIREEINLEEMQDTNKAKNAELEEDFNGLQNFFLQKSNKSSKPPRKSSIEMIRDEIKEEINQETNQMPKQQEQKKQQEEFSIFKEIKFGEKIDLPQPEPPVISSLSSQKISPPPGFPSPQKQNQVSSIKNTLTEEQQFKISDFNYLNSNETYYQYQSPISNQIIRSNSEQQGLTTQFSQFSMQNKLIQKIQQQSNGIQQQLNGSKNNTPSGIQKKKMRLESDQFMNYPKPQTPQTQAQQQTQQQQQLQFQNNIQSPLTSQQPQQFNILSPFSQQQQQQTYQFQTQKSEKRKPLILSETNIRYQGTVKFFDEVKGYGFIIVDNDSSEVFFHMDDIQQPYVNKEYIMTYKKGNIVRFSFTIMRYIGKYNQSIKATEIQLIQSP